jgi:hypothetical protein
MEIFARPVTITPVVSQPGAPPYSARGIFDTNELEIEALEETWVTSTRTELDIMETEFGILPMQDDLVSIPADEMIPGGEFIVSDVTSYGNAGGEVTLVLKRRMMDRLIGTSYSLGITDPGSRWPALGWSFPVLTAASNDLSLSYLEFDRPWLNVSKWPI